MYRLKQFGNKPFIVLILRFNNKGQNKVTFFRYCLILSAAAGHSFQRGLALFPGENLTFRRIGSYVAECVLTTSASSAKNRLL